MMKRKRIRDEALLELIRTLRCLGCGRTPCDAHHVTTVKAGGDDVATNVMPLCRVCHTRWHARGPTYMFKTHPAIRYWLEAAGRTDILERQYKLPNRGGEV